jgi:O-antigen ligase/Tfp pilus assembly protein PilF
MKRSKTKKRNSKSGAINNSGSLILFYSFFGIMLTALPLVYYRNGLDPALHPRLLFLSIFLIVAAAVLFLYNRKTRLETSVLKSPIIYLLGAYLFFTLLSALFAINPLEVNFDFSKVFITLTIVGFASILFANTPDWHRRLPVVMFIPAAILAFTGLQEYFEYAYNAGPLPAGRTLPWIYDVRGLMAHKNQFTMAIMLLLPFLGFAVYAFKDYRRYVAAILILAILFLIVVLKTRSVWVGLAGATTVVIIIVVFFGSRLQLPKFLRISIGGGFLALVLAFAAIVVFTETNDQDSIIFKLQNITNPADPNNIHRVKIWKITSQMIAEKPLQGWGAGNWKINVPFRYKGYDFSKTQLNWLRPHNDYLWVFAEKGIFGFLAFIGLFVVSIFYLIKNIFSPLSHEKKALSVFLLAGVVAYMAISFFDFPLERINQQVYLGLIFAATIALRHETKAVKGKSAPLPALLVPVILVLAYIAVYSNAVLEAETKVRQARILQFTKPPQWKQMNELAKTIPKSFRSIDAEAMPIAWYEALSYANLDNSHGAIRAYEEAKLAHPSRVAILNNLGQQYFKVGDYKNAERIFLESLEILPDYFEAIVNLSSTYIQTKDWQKAHEYLMKINKSDLNEPLRNNIRMVRRNLEQIRNE